MIYHRYLLARYELKPTSNITYVLYYVKQIAIIIIRKNVREKIFFLIKFVHIHTTAYHTQDK